MLTGRRGAAAVIAVLLAAALALLGAWLASGRSGAVGGELVTASADGDGAGGGGHPFSVSGSVTGLFPGAHKDLLVTVTNPMPFAIRVTQLSATVTDASATCAAANLTVGHFMGTLQVPANGAATVTLPVTMSHAAGDACQGARFPLRYSATATNADDPAGPSPTACVSEGNEPCE